MFDLQLSLSLWQLIPALAIILGAAILRGYSGFGFSSLTVTSLALFMSPKMVVPAIFMLEIAASIHLLPSVFRQIDRKLLGQLMVGTLICTPIGAWLLAHLPEAHTRLMICLMVLVIAILLLLGFEQKRPNPRLPLATGFVSGLANGAAAIGGLPVVLMMLYTGMSAIATRATLVAFFAFTDIYALLWTGHQDLITSEVVTLGMLFLIPMVIGISVGSCLFKRSGKKSFRNLALVLLISVSVIGLARSAYQLLV